MNPTFIVVEIAIHRNTRRAVHLKLLYGPITLSPHSKLDWRKIARENTQRDLTAFGVGDYEVVSTAVLEPRAEA